MTLEDCVLAGDALSYGLATNKSEAEKILKEYPQFNGCIQVGNNILDNSLKAIDVNNNLLTISHSALAGVLSKVQGYLDSDRQVLNRWSQELDFDLAQINALAKLLILDSLFANQRGIVLFASGKTENIKSNIELLNQNEITYQTLSKLRELIRSELIST